MMKTMLILLFTVVIMLLLFCKCDVSDHTNHNAKKRRMSSIDTNNTGLCIFTTPYRCCRGRMDYFNADTIEIVDTPFIKYKDIISYDTLNHTISLTYDIRKKWIKNFDQYLNQTPFIITLDTQRIYGGWFTRGPNAFHSRWIIIKFMDSFDSLKANQIRIKYEDEFEGIDPRNNSTIFKRLIQDNKAK